MDYSKIITIEPGKRGAKPCIRGLRVTVYDVLEYLASGMTNEQILHDFPYLTEQDIRAPGVRSRPRTQPGDSPGMKLLLDENLPPRLTKSSDAVLLLFSSGLFVREA